MSVLARFLQRSDGAADDPVIEPMRRRHLTQMMPIEQVSYPKPWSRSVFESELDQVRGGLRHYLVARRGRSVVGYAGLWITPDPTGDQAHVTNIAVAPDQRRTGVATALLVAQARHAIERGCVAWTLEVRVSSTGAQELYRRFGFAPAGIRRRYYENTEDAIVMWCHDLGTPEYAERLEELACGR
jgi:ribosomal-protein-alanine N-acetyltransferase